MNSTEDSIDAAVEEDDTITASSPTCVVDEETVSWSRVSTVANELMFDFVFLSLCRCFRERNLDHFKASLNTLEAIVVNRCSPLTAEQAQKKDIAAFLARIMYGKDLKVKFEANDEVLPLMSAVDIWGSLRKTVTEDSLFENISQLLLVQAVAVCLEKGQPSRARAVLKWLTERHDIARNVSAKLSLVSCRADIYHPFLLNFSFQRLQEAVQGYLDAYLERKPSDFLLKAATRMIQSNLVNEDDSQIASDDSQTESTTKSTDIERQDIEEDSIALDDSRPESTIKSTEGIERQDIKEDSMALDDSRQESTIKSTEDIERQDIEEDSMALDDSRQESTMKSTEDIERQDIKEDSTALDDSRQESTIKPTEDIERQDIKDDSMASVDSLLESTKNSTKDIKSMDECQTTLLRRKKKTLLPKECEMLMSQPDALKIPVVRLNIIPKNITRRLTCQGVCPESPDKSQSNSVLGNPRKKRMKWNDSMDALLKKGVERHGVGKWALILQDYDFPGRTSVMLKDRWRVLKKNYLV